MKRGAEKQISKLDQLSEDEETEEASEFRKADESTLAVRKIRSLPKRAFAGSVTTTVNGTSTSESESSTGVPKFSGFSGFAQSTSSPFTFAAKPSFTSEPPPQPLAASSLASAPTTVSTTASTTAKALASFLGAPPDASATQKLNATTDATSLAFPLVMSPPQVQPLSFVQPSTGSEPANDSAVKYFMDLRGLNVSFVSALSRAMSEDPFVDFSQLLEQYKSKRSTIQSDYDRTKKPETSSKEMNKNTTDTKPNPPSMPAPPTSFSFGGTAFGTPSFKPATSNNGGGFKPSLPTTADTPSPFQIGSTSSTQSSEFSNVPSNGATGKPSSFASTTNAFSFGAKSDLPNPFKLSASSTSTTGGTAPAFGGSSFFSQQPSSSPVAKPPSATPSSAFNVFGKPSGSGSIGNPVGFGFGANAKSSEDVDTKSAPTSGFVFGHPSSSSFGKFEAEKKAENNEDGEEEAAGTDGSGATEGDEAAKVGVSSPTAHDVEGEGEEEEETIHSVRLKAHRMRKADEKGGQAWVELGVGYLRLKRHKETDARRMLLRNSSTGKINIVTQTKKSLTFIGHDSGVAQTYNVRLPNEDQIRELKAAIEREVALIKAQD
ncbi:hypothetical protein JOM56_002052 [Amanita muscaria]